MGEILFVSVLPAIRRISAKVIYTTNAIEFGAPSVRCADENWGFPEWKNSLLKRLYLGLMNAS